MAADEIIQNVNVDGVPKEIKNYSGRLRINITNKDGLNAGDNVVVIPAAEYESLVTGYTNLLQKVEMMEHEQQNFNEIMKNLTESIYAEHRIQLEMKDNIIKEKDTELNRIKAALSKFTTSFNGLSAIDVLFRHRHKKLIDDFHESIWINVPMDQVEDVEVLPKTE